MQHPVWWVWPRVVLVVAALMLAGCAEPQPPAALEEVSRPVKVLEVAGADAGSGLRFPGRVRAVQRAELAFNVPGRIVEFPAREGQVLAAGALIARLDPADYEIRLAAAQAEFDKARTDYERVERIWQKSQAVARAEVDQKRTAMEVARSRFAAARKDVADTALIAPFPGMLTRRHVEQFANVQAKQPIASLQDDALEIVIHVPERVVRGEPRRAAGYALFEDVPGRRFEVVVKSFSSEADPQTQTYQVVLGIERPDDVLVLPGMAVEVFPKISEASGQALLVPMNAVFAASDGQPSVWVIDPESSRVSRRPVTVGRTDGDQIVVQEGLEVGERMAVSGVHHLRDGMLVRPL
jgi:membrane fusion protein, multidrug efflux system